MVEYMFERGLNIHEIKALYGGAGWQAEADNAANLAEGLANSTVMTARDDGRLVGWCVAYLTCTQCYCWTNW